MNHAEKLMWCIEQHSKTGHTYGEMNEPYSVHLHRVNNIAKTFFYLIEENLSRHVPSSDVAVVIQLACYGHDLIEDTRNTYNDVKNVLGEQAADIIYALTNEKGKNRAERANDKYYEGVRNTPYAVFVKLCDRIANVQYSIETQSSIIKAYRKENEKFMKHMGYDITHECKPMFDHLLSLINEG